MQWKENNRKKEIKEVGSELEFQRDVRCSYASPASKEAPGYISINISAPPPPDSHPGTLHQLHLDPLWLVYYDLYMHSQSMGDGVPEKSRLHSDSSETAKKGMVKVQALAQKGGVQA